MANINFYCVIEVARAVILDELADIHAHRAIVTLLLIVVNTPGYE